MTTTNSNDLGKIMKSLKTKKAQDAFIQERKKLIAEACWAFFTKRSVVKNTFVKEFKYCPQLFMICPTLEDLRQHLSVHFIGERFVQSFETLARKALAGTLTVDFNNKRATTEMKEKGIKVTDVLKSRFFAYLNANAIQFEAPLIHTQKYTSSVKLDDKTAKKMIAIFGNTARRMETIDEIEGCINISLKNYIIDLKRKVFCDKDFVRERSISSLSNAPNDGLDMDIDSKLDLHIKFSNQAASSVPNSQVVSEILEEISDRIESYDTISGTNFLSHFKILVAEAQSYRKITPEPMEKLGSHDKQKLIKVIRTLTTNTFDDNGLSLAELFSEYSLNKDSSQQAVMEQLHSECVAANKHKSRAALAAHKKNTSKTATQSTEYDAEYDNDQLAA